MKSSVVRAATALGIALLLSGASEHSSNRTLSIEQRIGDLRAVEAVYWAHRIWPSVPSERKPAFDEVLPETMLRARVEESLQKSAALKRFWNRPISPQDLQAEVNRMAAQSQNPALLRELFAALGNDPQRIAQTLALPVLADRRMRSWYAFDDHYHGELRARAQRGLERAGGRLDRTGGEYVESEYARTQGAAPAGADTVQTGAPVPLSPEEWDRLISQLAETYGIGFSPGSSDTDAQVPRLPLHRPSALREEPDRFFATTILEASPDKVKFAVVTWTKRSFDAWWQEVKRGLNPEEGVPASFDFAAPSISSGACVHDTWKGVRTAVPSGRNSHSTIWTGTEMIVWGGFSSLGVLNTGHRYNPATDTWTSTRVDASTPTVRQNHTAVWTGSEMIVWGGSGLLGVTTNTGGRYNPAADSWNPTRSDLTAPSARYNHSAVWTGSEMIIWGGRTAVNGAYLNTGARYNPGTDSWVATRSDASAPAIREGHTAVWTGTEMIVWGGHREAPCCPWTVTDLSTGGRYNPSTDSWTLINNNDFANNPSRSEHTAVWTGTEMIIWGGIFRSINQMTGQVTVIYLKTGDRYNPASNTWTATRSDSTAPLARTQHTAIWTGSQMVVWGGQDSGGSTLVVGGRYNPSGDSWTPTNFIGAPPNRATHGAVWTGSEMIVWGGIGDGGYYLPTGGRYNPSTDSWVPTAYQLDYYGQSVWTGTQMIVWGYLSLANNSWGYPPAGLYSPATDSWLTGTAVSAPRGRAEHTAVWTGSEMIVWGGRDAGATYLTSGGRYDPTADHWTPTRDDATTPTARQRHTAVWTGAEMIVWGGNCCGTGPATGGRYNPSTDTWTPTRADSSAPPSVAHTAIWTGNEMIIWGGSVGGRYDPSSDTWVLITLPDARANHTAVWTGTGMIVWGGYLGSTTTNTGWRYNPATGISVPTSTGTGVPTPRYGNVAIWDGDEMVIWGGYGPPYYNDGSRYNPSTDAWTPIGVGAATPQPQAAGPAVWTGTEMIIWGGVAGGRYCTCAAPTTYYQDADGDGLGNSATAAAYCGIPDGHVTAGGDCNDADAGIWSIPGEALGLRFNDAVTLAWGAPTAPGATALSYDLIRSTSPANFTGSGSCVATNTSSLTATDPSVPSLGSALHYLVRAENACPGGQGPLGTDSNGVPRTGLSCP